MSHIPAILHILVLIGFAFLVVCGLVIGAVFVGLTLVSKARNR